MNLPAGMLATDAVVTGIGVVVPPGTPADPGRPWFDTRARLGPRGYKYLPAASRYLLAAAREAMADGGGLDLVPGERRAATFGTNSGSAAVLDGMDRTVADGHADDLSPAMAPFFAINVLGSRPCAEYEVKGFQLTLTSPRVAGLEAMEVGLRALSLGRCSSLLVAAMEDGPPGPASPVADGPALPEEGAVAMVFEPPAAAAARGGRWYGACRARTAFLPPHLAGTREGQDRLGRIVTDLLTGLGADRPLPVHVIADGSAVGETVAAVLTAHPRTGPITSRTAAGLGCLTPMVRLAGLLAARTGDRLIVTATAEGNLALARIFDPGRSPC
ncbi:hypothetical protein NE235_35455 [Actinoallomurus spadix]|uniref:Beta-ketoacyl synthase-like N-terminal domain-containing protein n=1 Tax=Actinoallomurus spadix TaxID=79912 RepID=A0ABN0XUS7_9ACTN|nr:beta-ketoacyl synthase N-terminal-like domain-containing protein [Actinoallomurus spadix]MCO5991424.1 hypothetical protein [Actinoallomurus spadix]